MAATHSPTESRSRPPTPTWVKAFALGGLLILGLLIVTQSGGVAHGPGLHDGPMATMSASHHPTPT